MSKIEAWEVLIKRFSLPVEIFVMEGFNERLILFLGMITWTSNRD